MSMTQIAVDDTTLARLDAIACTQSRSRSELVHEALTTYIELLEISREVEAARTDFANGDVYSSEEVESYFAAKRTSLPT